MSKITDEEQKKIFSENLSKYVDRSGKQQKDIALDLGFNPKTFNGWCMALSMPSMGKVQAIADYFHIGKSDLLDKDVPAMKKVVNAIRIPVYGAVPAGIPIEAIEDIIDYEEITEEMARGGEYFGLVIKGDSMTPDLKEKDVVIVRKQEDAESGDIVIALVNGNDACCKRLMKYAGGVQLLSNNPAYAPMMFTYDGTTDEDPVRIIGKVVEARRKY